MPETMTLNTALIILSKQALRYHVVWLCYYRIHLLKGKAQRKSSKEITCLEMRGLRCPAR